jgi:hypothetical protein
MGLLRVSGLRGVTQIWLFGALLAVAVFAFVAV